MTEHILIFLNLLAGAVLVGKIVFLSFVTATVLSRTLDAEAFAPVVRSLFSPYYGLGMLSAAVGWSTRYRPRVFPWIRIRGFGARHIVVEDTGD